KKRVSLSFGYKLLLFFVALVIAVLSLYYTNSLIEKIKNQEQKRIELWASAYKDIIQTDIDKQISIISFEILQNNHTIPVIMTDENDEIISFANLDSVKAQNPEYLQRQLLIMKSENEPLVIKLTSKHSNYIYYRNSFLLTKLQNYPFFQMFLVLLFVLVAYFLLVISKKADDNRIWIGMSKETAHQLGTPISSLLAWVEMMKIRQADDPMLSEVEKDVNRLEMITERFARIGSEPKLVESDLISSVKDSIEYIKLRTSDKVQYIFKSNIDSFKIKLNRSLFQWIIENLAKNAIDAMSGKGEIFINIDVQRTRVILDFQDSGKGMSKNEYRKIFNTGYTTKKYGWGMGLALVKRIVEDYHKGKIYVLKSEVNVGTTIRLEMKI
ncbi:MAG: HAMP domain-containing sensor histidine kinase, partial [Bacteroidota bacterium]|nr:HAMP domain-containing sensor histidine kinase [Bacteroidota bacterium]